LSCFTTNSVFLFPFFLTEASKEDARAEKARDEHHCDHRRSQPDWKPRHLHHHQKNEADRNAETQQDSELNSQWQLVHDSRKQKDASYCAQRD
jgi:hypothetical protein